jgi:hypothetical protein
VVLLFLCVLVLSEQNRPYKISFIVDKTNVTAPCELISMKSIAKHRMLKNTPIYVTSTPHIIREHDHDHDHEHEHHHDDNDVHIVHVYGVNEEIAVDYFRERCPQYFEAEKIESGSADADEVIQLINSGSPANRIDLVFMGDGYTANQRTQMIADMTRLVDDMFTGTTFTPYLPLFNVWIVFRASTQSGIGTGGVPLNTAFRLYRDGTQLRGVYCGNAPAARDACRAPGPDACDFPTLIGNSPFYGGLGGEFTISTSSETSGTVVLRHELGHNFGSVGEEYDGGSSYFGANFANSVAVANTKWKAWLDEDPLTVQDATLLLQDYPWYLLQNGPRRYTFTSTGNYNRWYLSFTASGCPEPGSFGVYLDGVALPLKAANTEDRTFYKFFGNTGFTSGTHELLFRQLTPPTGTYPRQLCSLTLHEYKNDPLFHWEEFYSGYRTWRQGNTLAGYRPTNEYCLMRNMTSPNFCKICQENMWIQFFQIVDAIDNITQTCTGTSVTVKLNVIPLAQFRPNPIQGELYVLEWQKDQVPVPERKDQFQWTLQRSQAVGTWKALLKFYTPQVRQDPSRLLEFETTITITASGPCQ